MGINTRDRRNPKHSKQSMNADQKSLDTVFDCHLSPVRQHMAIGTLVSNYF